MRLALGRVAALTVTLALATLKLDDQTPQLLRLPSVGDWKSSPQHVPESLERVLVHGR